MTQTSTPAGQVVYYYTDPNTGRGIPCTVLASDDGWFDVQLVTGQRGIVSAGDQYCTDESGRYLGGPRQET